MSIYKTIKGLFKKSGNCNNTNSPRNMNLKTGYNNDGTAYFDLTDEHTAKMLMEQADKFKKVELYDESSLQYIEGLLTATTRRETLGRCMNGQKLECPKCGTRQIQLVGYINTKPAEWKCRTCKHKFKWEGGGDYGNL